jgi:hypothetical protein
MTISDENRRRGWTPELVDWVQQGTNDRGAWASHVNRLIRFLENSVFRGQTLWHLQLQVPQWHDLIQALPAEALEQLEPDGYWQTVTTLPGSRKPGMCYRVKDSWQLGEWVEDEVEDGPTGGDLLNALIEEHDLPLVLKIHGTLCLLECKERVPALKSADDLLPVLTWTGGEAWCSDNIWCNWSYLDGLCNPETITRHKVEIIYPTPKDASRP